MAQPKAVLVSKFVKYVPNVYTALLPSPATGSNNHTSLTQTPSNLDIKFNETLGHRTSFIAQIRSDLTRIISFLKKLTVV